MILTHDFFIVDYDPDRILHLGRFITEQASVKGQGILAVSSLLAKTVSAPSSGGGGKLVPSIGIALTLPAEAENILGTFEAADGCVFVKEKTE